MHQVCEVGIAAHWRYKEGTKSDREYDAKLAWLRQLMDWQRDVSDATEFVEGIKLDIFQDQVFVFTPEGRHQGPAGRRHAARLRLPDPHRRRPPHDRRQGQQPPRPARLPAQERRHRRDRDDQGRARPVARLAERRPDQPRPREDPPMVQAQGARREHRPRPRVARARAAPPGPDLDRGGRPRPDRRGRRGTTTTTTLDDFYAAIGYGAVSAQYGGHAPRRRRRRPERRCRRSRRRSSSTRTGGVRVKGVGDLLVRFAKCCHPIPGDPIVGFITRGKGVTVHLQTCPTVVNEREVSRLIEVEWEAAPDADLPDRDPGRGLRPDRPAVATSPRSWPRTRSTSWPPHVGVTPDHTAVVTATLQVASVVAAGPGHEPHRAAQGRHQRPARPRLGAPRAARRGRRER